jgi:hypothetical protein
MPFTLISGYEISNVSRQLGHGVEQNAFGAKVDVRYGRMTSVGIGAITSSASVSSVRFDPDWNVRTFQVTELPNAAKAITQSARVVVEGTIAPLENGYAEICDDDGAPATFCSPTSVTERFCVSTRKSPVSQ